MTSSSARIGSLVQGGEIVYQSQTRVTQVNNFFFLPVATRREMGGKKEVVVVGGGSERQGGIRKVRGRSKKW